MKTIAAAGTGEEEEEGGATQVIRAAAEEAQGSAEFSARKMKIEMKMLSRPRSGASEWIMLQIEAAEGSTGGNASRRIGHERTTVHDDEGDRGQKPGRARQAQ
jgi:hypothetical protein